MTVPAVETVKSPLWTVSVVPVGTPVLLASGYELAEPGAGDGEGEGDGEGAGEGDGEGEGDVVDELELDG